VLKKLTSSYQANNKNNKKKLTESFCSFDNKITHFFIIDLKIIIFEKIFSDYLLKKKKIILFL